jgi:hypothetical protein
VGVSQEESAKKEGVANLRDAIKELKLPASVVALPEATAPPQQRCVAEATSCLTPQASSCMSLTNRII